MYLPYTRVSTKGYCWQSWGLFHVAAVFSIFRCNHHTQQEKAENLNGKKKGPTMPDNCLKSVDNGTPNRVFDSYSS
jgi:hypothetical protein